MQFPGRAPGAPQRADGPFFGAAGRKDPRSIAVKSVSGDRREATKTTNRCRPFLKRPIRLGGGHEDERHRFNTLDGIVELNQRRRPSTTRIRPRGLARPPAARFTSASRRVSSESVNRRLRSREPPGACAGVIGRDRTIDCVSWWRVYRHFSPVVGVSGRCLAGHEHAISHIELVPNLPVEGGPATRARIVDDEPLAPVYATLLWRWPQVRGFAENQARGSMRLLVNLIPDVAGGLSLPPRRHNSYLVGGSWPILADRLSFIMGLKTFREERPANGFVVGQYVPADTSIGEIRGESQRHVDLLFGLAVELVRSR